MFAKMKNRIFASRQSEDHKGRDDAKFGMFAGVFTPTVLTVLGAIMYLRTGWVVGMLVYLGHSPLSFSPTSSPLAPGWLFLPWPPIPA